MISDTKEAIAGNNLKVILNNMGDPVFVKDDRSRMVLVNDAFCNLFGRTREEIIGKTLAEDVPPEEQEHFLKVDNQVLSDGVESVIEESLTIRGGETMIISTRKTRFIDENGDRFLVCVIRDITAIKNAEELGRVNRLNEVLLSAAQLLSRPDVAPVKTLQGLTKLLAHHFGSVCDISVVDDTSGVIRPIAIWHSDEEVRSVIKGLFQSSEVKKGEGLVGSVIETGKEVCIPQVPEAMQVEPLRVNPKIVPVSMIYVPLCGSDGVIGSLNITRIAGSQVLVETELEQIRTIGQYISLFVENVLLKEKQENEIERRKRIEQRLERSTEILERMEADTRKMLNAIPIYIIRVSINFRMTFLNEYHQNIGVKPSLWEGKFVWELIGRKMFDRMLPDYERALGGEVLNVEVTFDDADAERHYNVALAPDFNESGEMVGFYICATDMSDKIAAEEEAKLTQDRFESLSLNSGDAFFFHDSEQNILDVNQVATDMLGYTRDELLQMKAEQVDPKWKKDVYQRYMEELDVNTPQTFDTTVFAKDGTEIPVEVRFVKREENGLTYIQSLLRDRTEKREQELRLERSEERLRSIFENVEDFIATVSADGIVESVNKTTQGVQPEDVIGGSVFDWYSDSDVRVEVEEGFRNLKETGQGFEIETNTYHGPDGTVRTYYNKYIAKFEEGKLYKAILIIRDVTGDRNRERSVMNAVLKGQEQERKRLGAELHDGIGQVLSAIALQVSRIREVESNGQQHDLGHSLSKLSENLQAAIKEVRNISHDLMPEVLEGFGLKEALSQTCRNLEDRTGVEVKFNHIDVEERYDQAIEFNLFRVAQELLNNVQKHARCKKVFVSLMDHGDSLSLSVEDDGIGFNNPEDSKGIGLKNVRSRVDSIGGDVHVESAQNSGTLINIEVPKPLK